ncbi:general stress protein [Actinoplanes sp. CA-015351]|uniref:general stress protein n=1 Tax=Actinoplanes sp. CA-015351 TaxID=3239897 RepID=UPI003D993E75
MTSPSTEPTTPIPAGTPAAATPSVATPAAATPTGPGTIPPGPAGVPTLPAQTGPAQAAAAAGPTVVVGTYPEYALAQQAVDHLSDNKFPVERVSIVGTDLRLVETVLGRLTTARAALAGAASGAWFGLFIGLLFGIFSDESWFGLILTTLIIGAIWGAIFGAIAHAATGGRRDFSSRSSLQAAQYAVLADADVADEARTLLVQLNWRASGAE